MKKIIYSFLLVILTTCAYSQLEVTDTVLLAFKNDQFWSSSSELEQDIYKDFGKYGALNVSDSDPETCWAEGSETDGSGEYLLTVISENISSLRIRNGYQKSESIYNANKRPKTIKFTLYASYQPSGYVTETHTGFCISEPLFTSIATLKDQFGYQDVNTGINWPNIYEELSYDRTFDKDHFILKIEIIDVYNGTKWNDACISDINIIPSPYFNITEDEHGFIKITDFNTDTLFYNHESIFQIVEISNNTQWIIFIEMAADIGDSRAETIYRLYNIEKEKFIELNNVYEMYGFSVKNDSTYLDGSDNELNMVSICIDGL